MRLNDPLVTSFTYEQENYNIDLSFDNVLDVFDVLEDKSMREAEKVEICLSLLLDEQDYTLSVDFWNYIYESFINIATDQKVEYDLQGNPMPTDEGDSKKLISITEDGAHIYASFMEAYNMDLFEVQTELHWSKFQALLNGLPPETIMQRIIQIRGWKASKGDTTEYKKSMYELQKAHALESDEVENGEGSEEVDN